MRYSGIIYNDMNAAPGISVTYFAQGCPHHCKNCHNPETWDFQGGLEFKPTLIEDIYKGLTANNILRNFCIMGGEPLCQENLFLTTLLIKEIKEKLPSIKIYLWSGYTYEELIKKHDKHIDFILDNIFCLIDGPYIDELRDISLFMRGSSNQQIIYMQEGEK